MDMQVESLNNLLSPWVGKQNAVMRVCRRMLVELRMLPRSVYPFC